MGEIDAQNHPRIKCQDSGTSFRPGILASRPPLAWSGGPLWIVVACTVPEMQEIWPGQWEDASQDRARIKAPTCPFPYRVSSPKASAALSRGCWSCGQWVHLIQSQHWRPGDYQGARISQSAPKPRLHSIYRRPYPKPVRLWPRSRPTSCPDPFL